MILHYFFAFFCQNTSVPSVYVKTITLDKLQKYNRIPNGAESCHTHLTLSVYLEHMCFVRHLQNWQKKILF